MHDLAMMQELIMISPTTQYIIDAVRLIRLELGLSQRTVSRFINPETDSNIVGNIETVTSKNGYTDHNLNILAIHFSEYAITLQKELNVIPENQDKIKTEYTIYDFYPKHTLSDTLQIKTKIDIPSVSGPSATLNSIIESQDFLDTPRSLKDITDYCNSFHKRAWKTTNFSSTVDFAVKKEKIKRIESPKGKVLYQKC